MSERMNLTQPLADVVGPLFDLLPRDLALTQLVVHMPPGGEPQTLVEQIVGKPPVDPDSHLAAGLWLYVDDLHRSHRISQQHKDATGAFWHGIMHRREGDFGNSQYWFRQAGDHPAMAQIDGYDPGKLIDDVEAAAGRGDRPKELIELQRREWCALFEYCAGQ